MSVDQYYTLGRTGLRVSRLSLGTMTFGTPWGWGADRETSRRMFDMYLDAGGNFIDTADTYTNGISEEFVGEFVAESKSRDRVVIATKYSNSAQPGNPNASGNGRKNMLRAVDASLKRLKTDYLDLYILHTWDQVTPAEEVVRTFDDLVSSGKVRHVGLSDTPAWYAARVQTLAECDRLEPVAAIQLEYSLVERNIEREFPALCAATGMGITVWGPIGSGLLSGKYRPGAAAGEPGGRLEKVKAPPGSSMDKFNDRNWKIVAELEAVSREMGRSMAQVAINWVAHRPCVSSVILGATKPEQLQDNLQALDFEVPAALRERLDEVGKPNAQFPYTFFSPSAQSRLHGGATVGSKPAGYMPEVLVKSAKK
jgi:aryl-alcohol dehydrogenase-like predicted oxidoreductase